MDYPKILQKQKNPYRFFIKSLFYIEGKNSDFAQGEIVPKKNEAGCKSKKNPQNSCSSKELQKLSFWQNKNYN